MREFFRGWRRKIGCVTLLMSMGFMTLWVRSLSFVDAVSIPIAKHTLLNVSSDDQSVICETQGIEFRELTWDFLQWDSGPRVVTTPDGKYGIHWLWKWHGFGVGDGIAFPDIPPSFSPATICSFPYWSLVVPLTLISLWLLLPKRRKSPSKTNAEPAPSEEANS